MTNFYEKSAAAIAAIVIVTVSWVSLIDIPQAYAASIVAMPILA